MSYVHWAIAHVKDSDGRSLNLTGTPTITVYNVATEAAIASPAASLVNLATGLYKVKIALDAITKVAFKLVPHADDLATVADIALLDDGVVHVADDILTDTGTTIPASIDALPTAAEIWANSTRTLTQSATSITAAVSGSSITDIRGNDWAIEITGLTLDSNKQQFFIKRSAGYQDAEAILGIDSDTGTLYVNGVAATEDQELLASLSYTGTTLTVTVDSSITAQIPAGIWVYGIQSITAAGVVAESYGGTFIVTADVVRAVA